MKKFKSLSVKNYKNLYEWVSLDLYEKGNKSIKNKISFMGKNGIGKSNFLKYFMNISQFIKGADIDYPINSEFEFDIILNRKEFNIYGKFLKNNEKTTMPIEIVFKSSISNNVNNKIYKIPMDYLKRNFDLNITILELNREIILYILTSFLYTKDFLSEEDISFCELLGLRYSRKFKKISTNHLEYSEEVFKKSFMFEIKDILSKIYYLDWSNEPLSQQSDYLYNKDYLLTFLIENQNIFNNITHRVEKLDSDINNIRIEKSLFSEEYILFFNNRKGKKLNFAEASTGTRKFFAMLNIIYYLQTLEYYKLILIDEIDSCLNNNVIKEIINSINPQIQYIFTHHRPSLLTSNLNVFKLEEMYFFSDEDADKNIYCLTQYENWQQYKRNHKLIFDYIENLLGTEVEF